MAASTTARASGFSRSRYSVIPPPRSCPHDSTVRPRCRSSRSCTCAPRPYRASIAGRSRRTPAGPSTSPIATSPAATAGTASGSTNGVSCRSSEATTHPADTDSRPCSTAARAPANADTDADAEPVIHPGGQLADRLRDQPGFPGVQGRAPVGDPLRRQPRLRRGHLTAFDRIRGDRVPAGPRRRPRPGRQPPAAPRVQVGPGQPVHLGGQVLQRGGGSGQHGDQLLAVAPHPRIHEITP